MRYLGVDLGRARIGLALADDVLRVARPLRTAQRRTDQSTLADIAASAREFEVDRAVVGLPLNMDGTEGEAARHARAFAEKLGAALGIPVELFDERLSTFEAETRLRDQGFSAKDRRSLVDAEAAAVILQGWLDGSDGVKRALVTFAAMGLLAAAAAGALVWRQLALFRETPYGALDEKVVAIPSGASARAVVRVLAHAGALSDERLAWRYVRWLKRDPRPFRAGEYAFSGPLRPDEVLERVYRGDVKLHRFTVPEGLRADEIAGVVGRSGLASEGEFLAAAHDPELARSLGLPYPGLEGFLFPDTYAFAQGVSARTIAEEMVERFKQEYVKANELRKPGIVFSMGEAATFASIVEKETSRPEERPRIACVFHNRIQLGMRLQTDPTVMYATMLRTGKWSRNISRADLLAPHPYNTYTSGGLPPGPIANPGAAALRATLSPSECRDLYFVSRNDGTHVFCPDLRCHNAAVRQWQVEFFRRAR